MSFQAPQACVPATPPELTNCLFSTQQQIVTF
jgi:hypothetical protein